MFPAIHGDNGSVEGSPPDSAGSVMRAAREYVAAALYGVVPCGSQPMGATGAFLALDPQGKPPRLKAAMPRAPRGYPFD